MKVDLSYLPNADERWDLTKADAAWKLVHLHAIKNPRSLEAPVIHAIQAWLNYADTHQARYESNIGDDGVLGPAWITWGEALRVLLNGDCGRLDCGCLDHVLCENLKEQGWEE